MCQPLVSKLFNCKGGLREGYTGGHLRANGFKTISANVILLVNKEGYCWRLFTYHLWQVFKRAVERRN